MLKRSSSRIHTACQLGLGCTQAAEPTYLPLSHQCNARPVGAQGVSILQHSVAPKWMPLRPRDQLEKTNTMSIVFVCSTVQCYSCSNVRVDLSPACLSSNSLRSHVTYPLAFILFDSSTQCCRFSRSNAHIAAPTLFEIVNTGPTRGKPSKSAATKPNAKEHIVSIRG